jgi:hypothetical protein
MKALIVMIRALAVPLGLFCLVSASLDILGLVPYSNATPPLARRAAHALPLLLAGAIFLLPYRAVRSRPLRAVIGFVLILLVGATLYLAIDAAAGYLTGKKSWHIVPVALLIPALVAGNAWAFMRITRQDR